MKMTLLAGISLSMFAANCAAAAVVNPTGYDMPNGQTGTYTYYDDSYNGLGDKSATLSPLSGGLGDLTDGKFATDHWYNVSGVPYVGWYSISPVITFHFAQSIDFGSVTFYFDNTSDPRPGSVISPASWTVSDGSSSATHVTTLAEFADYSPNQAQTIDLTGFAGDKLTVTINPVAGLYTMISEVAFAGTPSGTSAAPEPASWAMMLTGFGVAGMAIRRRKQAQLRCA